MQGLRTRCKRKTSKWGGNKTRNRHVDLWHVFWVRKGCFCGSLLWVPPFPKNAHTIQFGVNYMMIDFVSNFLTCWFFSCWISYEKIPYEMTSNEAIGWLLLWWMFLLNIVLLCWLLLPGEFPYTGRFPNAWKHDWSTGQPTPPVTYWFPLIRPAIKP